MSKDNMDEALETAKFSGRLAIFDVNAFSFYPAQHIKERVNVRLYGQEAWNTGIANSDVRKRLQASGFHSADVFGLGADNDYNACTLDAQVWLVEERESIFTAMLDLRSIEWEGVPEYHAGVLPDTARFPHHHRVKSFDCSD